MKKLLTLIILLTSLITFSQTKKQIIYNFSTIYDSKNNDKKYIPIRIFLYHDGRDRDVRIYIGNSRVDYKIDKEFCDKTDDGTPYDGYILINEKDIAILQIFTNDISRFIVYIKDKNGNDSTMSYEFINKL